jgi:hypothetical protein
MARFIAVFLLTAAVGFAAMLPLRALNRDDLRRGLRMGFNPGRVIMLGDSVMTVSSHCDTNPASIPSLLANELREPVVDGSRPGSSLGTSLDALRVAALFRKFRVVVVPITVNGSLFRSVHSASDGERLWRDFAGGLSYVPKPPPARIPFKGRVYGGYEENAASYFKRERAASTCPESAGSDMAFVEYMYWLSFGQPVRVSEGFPQFVAWTEWLQQRGIATLAVLPPVNYQLMEMLSDPDVLANVRGAVADTERQLESARVPVANLSFALSSSVFADQWCACGHLNEEGRRQYARRVASRVRGLLGTRSN